MNSAIDLHRSVLLCERMTEQKEIQAEGSRRSNLLNKNTGVEKLTGFSLDVCKMDLAKLKEPFLPLDKRRSPLLLGVCNSAGFQEEEK